MRIAAIAFVLLAAPAAHADPDQVAVDAGQTASLETTTPLTRPEPVVDDQALTAETVRGAPRPGEEHGRLDPLDPGDGAGRKVARVLMWVPRLPFELMAQPLRGALYVRNRYYPPEGSGMTAPDKQSRFAVVPHLSFESQRGLHVAARARITNVLGVGERVTVHGGLGGALDRVAALDVEVGDRIAVGVGGRYELADEDFHGYGNGDVVTPTMPTMPIDPLTSDAAVATDLRTTTLQVGPHVRYRVAKQLSVTASSSFVDRSFASEMDDGTPAIEQAFDVGRLPGFTRGAQFLYNEVEVAWDTRGRGSDWDPEGLRTDGGLLLGFVGRQDGLRDGDPGFFRMGVDLQRYVRLTAGPRVLELRAQGELVTGERDEVPFSELPRLGGATVLRGYEAGRFRDRVAVVGQASYLWAASRWLAPSLFVDVGRVYSGLDDLSSKRPRVGYGLALEAFSANGVGMRFQVASSIDGGVMAYFALNPADPRSRAH